MMQELNNITVNSLPVKTWNFLRMNESKVEHIEVDKSAVVSMNREDFKGDIEFYSNVDNSKLADFSEVTTGIGNSLEDIDADNELIVIKDNIKADKPLIIKYKYNDNTKCANRLFFVSNQNSSLNVIVLFEAENSTAGVSVHEIKSIVKENANLNIYTANLLADGYVTLHNCGARCADNATFSLVQVITGSEKTYYGGYTKLEGKNSSFLSDIAYYANKEQILDMNYVAKHTGRKTNCDMSATGVLDDDAKKIFRGTIDFVKGCSGAKGNEREDVLLLSDNNVNQTIPLILCDEEDVEGNHGATIGKIDDEVIFYLGSRGISRKEAERMMAKARIKAVCDKFPSDEIREQITTYMEGRI